MKFMTEKQFEKELYRAMYEREERERIYRRLEDIDRKITDLDLKLHYLKMQVDPEYRRQNTPTCGPEVQCGRP